MAASTVSTTAAHWGELLAAAMAASTVSTTAVVMVWKKGEHSAAKKVEKLVANLVLAKVASRVDCLVATTVCLKDGSWVAKRADDLAWHLVSS